MSLTENTAPGSRKCCHPMRKHRVTLPASLCPCSLGTQHLITAVFPISNICSVSDCLTWQRTGLPSGARNWNGMCAQLSQSHLAVVSWWQGNTSQECISLYLLQTTRLQSVKCVLCYFQGAGMGEVSVSSSFHLSNFICSVGSSSVQGPHSSKQVCRAVPCSPLYPKKQAKPYLKIIIVIFSRMRVPAFYKGRKGKAF